MSEKQPYKLEYEHDSATGLRTAILTLYNGFPEMYLGKYVMTEWTYGEKVHAEMQCEQFRIDKIVSIKADVEKARKTPNNTTVIKDLEFQLKRLDSGVDTESFILVQTMICLKESPLTINGNVDNIKRLPGRLGTMLSNITGYLCLAPDEEKKG